MQLAIAILCGGLLVGFIVLPSGRAWRCRLTARGTARTIVPISS